MTPHTDDQPGWGEDFEWTQPPARTPRRGDQGLPPSQPERTDPSSPEPLPLADEPKRLVDRANEPLPTVRVRPGRPKPERRWIAIASVFVLGFALGGLVGYLSRGDGRPSNATTVDVALDQVTVTETR